MNRFLVVMVLAASLILVSCGQGGNAEGLAAIAASSLSGSLENGVTSGENETESAITASPTSEEKTPWLEDYDVFWSLVEENYSLYEAAGRITKNDYEVVKERYRSLAAETNSAGELYEVLSQCVQSFEGTGHFWLIESKESYRSMATLYGRLAQESAKCAYLYRRLHNPASIEYYQFDPAQEIHDILEGGGNETGTKSSGNLKFRDFPDDRAAYVSIASMTANFENNDGAVLREWFRSIEKKGYRSCIIDIRGNGGGDSNYWSNYLVGPNLKSEYTVTNYALVKGSECVSYWQEAGKKLEPVDTLPLGRLPALRQEDLEGVTHYITYTGRWKPSGDPLFSGRFWLLVDEGVYSSSEMFAAFCKDTGFATLVGENTGGDGIGEDPLVFALPNSGICFRFSAEEGLNADGSCSEEYGTSPDIAVGQGEDALQVCLDAIRSEQ